jgi:hypothetical protein
MININSLINFLLRTCLVKMATGRILELLPLSDLMEMPAEHSMVLDYQLLLILLYKVLPLVIGNVGVSDSHTGGPT